MANYSFRGNVNGISFPQLQFLHETIVKHGHENSKVIIEPVGKVGDNFMASVVRVYVEGENEKLAMVVKLAPQDGFLRKTLNCGLIYYNEHIMYSEILPKFDKLQKEAGLPEEDQLKFAKCYGSSADVPNEITILQDLRPLGYIMLDKFEPLTDVTVKSILKNFAVYHGLSFVLRHREPEKYDCFKIKVKDSWAHYIGDENFKKFLRGIEKGILSVLDNDKHKELVKNIFYEGMMTMINLENSEATNKYAVIQQGDAWTNNFLFKYEGDKLAASLMLDYQLIKNCSPACDILFMIFNCTTHESRLKNYYHWVDYYYTELEKILLKFDLKIEIVYPRDVLESDLRKHARMIFAHSAFLSNTLVRKTEDAADAIEILRSENIFDRADDLSVANLDEESKSFYKDRVTGYLDSLSELGFL